MPSHHWRDQDYAIVVFEGQYQPSSALDVIDAALGSDGPPVRGLLLDLTDSESFRARSSEGLRSVAQFLASRRERFGGRLAVVGAGDLVFGLLRMGMVFVSNHDIVGEVFRDRESALTWLKDG